MNGKRWNAGRSLRIAPLQGAYFIRNESCRERPMCRSASVERYLATNGLHSTSILYSKSSRMSRGRNRGGEKNAGLRSAFHSGLLEKSQNSKIPPQRPPVQRREVFMGEVLGVSGASSKEAPEWGAGQSPATFSTN